MSQDQSTYFHGVCDAAFAQTIALQDQQLMRKSAAGFGKSDADRVRDYARQTIEKLMDCAVVISVFSRGSHEVQYRAELPGYETFDKSYTVKKAVLF